MASSKLPILCIGCVLLLLGAREEVVGLRGAGVGAQESQEEKEMVSWESDPCWWGGRGRVSKLLRAGGSVGRARDSESQGRGFQSRVGQNILAGGWAG